MPQPTAPAQDAPAPVCYVEGDTAPYTVGYLAVDMANVGELPSMIAPVDGRWNGVAVLDRAQVLALASARRKAIRQGAYVPAPRAKGEVDLGPVLLAPTPDRFVAADGSGRTLYAKREVSGLEREARVDLARQDRAARYAAVETEA